MSSSISVSEALNLYLAELQERQCSQSHLATVAFRLGRFVSDRPGAAVSTVSGADIEAHFLALSGRGLANGTLAGYKSSQRAFWRWVVAQGWVGENPARVLNQRKYNYSFRPVSHQPADRDAFQAVMDVLLPFATRKGRAVRDVRDALIVSLAADSGVRRGELWNLRRADVERALRRGRPVGEGRRVYVTAVTGKTSTVLVRFFDESAKLAWLWLDAMPAGAVWLFCSTRTGERLHKDYLGSAFKRLCAYAGVPVFLFQAVRKRTVVDAIALSGDAKVGQLLAGHTDARTTAEYYNLLQQEQVNAAAAQLATARRGRPEAAGESLARELFKQDDNDNDDLRPE